MARRGRPSKYDDAAKQLSDIRKWREKGATKTDVARLLGIHIDTLVEWEKKYPEFSEAINARARDDVIYELRGKLYNLAMGGGEKISVKNIEIIRDANGNVLSKREKITERTLPPNPWAIDRMLNNIDPAWHANPKDYELRKEELELKKERSKKDDEEW